MMNKRIVSVLMVFAIMFCIVPTAVSAEGNSGEKSTVSVSVIGPDASGNDISWAETKNEEYSEGQTAWDMSAARFDSADLSYDAQDSSYGKYLNTITSPYTKEALGYDSASGKYWQFFVNGTASAVGASSVTPTDGDSYVWYYSSYGSSLPTRTVSVSVIGPDAGGSDISWSKDISETCGIDNTAWDASAKAFSSSGLVFDASDSSYGMYLNTITSPYTKEALGYDSASGKYWQFFVNGKVSEVGASSVKLSDGDSYVWYYSSYGSTVPTDTVSVSVIGPDGSGNDAYWSQNITCLISPDKNAWDASAKTFSLSGLTYDAQDSSYGKYLNTITSPYTKEALGYDSASGKYWQLFVNGKASEVGASSVKPAEGDSYVWYYSTYGASLPVNTVSVTVIGPDNNGNDSYWSEKISFLISDDKSAWDASAYAFSSAGLTYDAQDSSYGKYLNTITSPYTKEALGYDSASGKYWQFFVNGSASQVGASSVKTSGGGNYVWYYSTFGSSVPEVSDNTANVISMIESLPEPDSLSQKDKEAVEKASAAFSALNTKQQAEISSELKNKLTADENGIAKMEESRTGSVYDAYIATGNKLAQNSDPGHSSIGGEWSVVGMSRSGHSVQSGYFSTYLTNLAVSMSDSGGNLAGSSGAKYTEYSRAILGVAAAGGDVTNIGGYNLLEKLSDFSNITKQGLNGPIWALIALDSGNYEIPQMQGAAVQTTRDMLKEYILGKQLPGGGWALAGSSADPDITAMAVTALSKYCQSDENVKEAVSKAVTILGQIQNNDGSYGSDSVGGKNCESTAQVIIALTSAGINPDADTRFIKNGKSPVDALNSFSIDGGGFSHLPGGKIDGVATEQAYLALTAYYRLTDGKTSLYDMTDVTKTDDSAMAAEVDRLISLIGEVTADSGSTIEKARAAYNALTDPQKALVKELNTLESAESAFALLKNDSAPGKNENTASGSENKSEEGNGTAEKGTDKTVRSGTAQSESSSESSEDAKENRTDESAASLVDSMIKEILYPVDSTKKLPEDLSSLSDDRTEEILSVYKKYAALADDEKGLVTNYPEFEKVLMKLGDCFHYDGGSGISARDNAGDVIPWYVKLVVTKKDITGDRLEKTTDLLGEGSELLISYDISFIDMLSGTAFVPEKPVEIKIPAPQTEKTLFAALLFRENGDADIFECSTDGEDIVFTTDEFGEIGIAGTDNEVSNLLAAEEKSSGTAAKDSSLFLILIIAAAAGAAGIIVVVIIKSKNRHKNDV
jgi:hypothetical protein